MAHQMHTVQLKSRHHIYRQGGEETITSAMFGVRLQTK